MAGTNLGTAWIQIKPTTTGITSSVKKELAGVEQEYNTSVNNMGSTIKKVLGGAAIVAVAKKGIDAVVGLVKSAVSEFADYEQLVGGVDTLFKDSSAQVQEYAANAFKTAQISANEYMETVTSFSASLLQSLGGDTAKAAKYADTAIIDMADNANKMGTSMEMIQNAYQGFAKQNYTMLDNLKLGYGGTKTEMERLLSDAEKISGLDFDISSFADITQAIHIIQEEMGITGTSAEEASKTIAGSVNAMKASWNNLIVGVADGNQDFGKLMDNFVESASAAMGNILPRVTQALEGVSQLIVNLAPILAEQLPVLIEKIVPPLLQAAFSIINALIVNLPTLLNALLQGLLNALPSLIQSVVAMLPDLINGIVDFLVNPETIGLIIAAAFQLFLGIAEAIPQILGTLISKFGSLLAGLWNWITGAFGEFAGKFGNFLGNIFKGAINGVLSFIENVINGPIDLINGFIGVINGAFGWIGVNLGKIARISLPRLASGGIVEGVGSATSDSNLYALSKGEYVIRAAAAQEIGYDRLDAMNKTGNVGGGDVYNVTINGYNKNPEELWREFSRKIAFAQKGVY